MTITSIRFRYTKALGFLVAVLGMLLTADAMASTIDIAVDRSQLLSFPRNMSEVIVANPEIADVHNHGKRKLSIVGKARGKTSVRVLDDNGSLMGQYTVSVGVDLPAIRRALKQFLPTEVIGVEIVNTNIALTGKVSSAEAVDRAITIAREFIKTHEENQQSSEDSAGGQREGEDANHGIINLLQVTSGQQVMLRVRVGEVNRTALKQLGIEWANFGTPGDFFWNLAKDSGQEAFIVDSAGSFLVDTSETLTSLQFGWSNGGTGINGLLKALERDSLFKLLAEPNLVAVSGQEAEFLAGGEIPVPVPQTGGGDNQLTIEFKPFGVAVRFRPFVLAENRLRVEVQPEVSELDNSIAVNIAGFVVPGITTRRAKTTVELAPGESFMIAGLIKDEARTSIDNLPGAKELPVLGALFRSTEFQRDETELVIAVTPYLVDPVRSSDIKMPTDGFAHASDMEMIFYGALNSLHGGYLHRSQTPALEGPIGFMVD